VWGEQGFLLRGLVISPTKLTNCSLVSIEDTGSAVSDIMDSNGCSGVNADGLESLGVYQGEMTGSAPNEDFSPGAWLCGLSRLGCLPWCQ
jgi:hypothetical protein